MKRWIVTVLLILCNYSGFSQSEPTVYRYAPGFTNENFFESQFHNIGGIRIDLGLYSNPIDLFGICRGTIDPISYLIDSFPEQDNGFFINLRSSRHFSRFYAGGDVSIDTALGGKGNRFPSVSIGYGSAFCKLYEGFILPTENDYIGETIYIELEHEWGTFSLVDEPTLVFMLKQFITSGGFPSSKFLSKIDMYRSFSTSLNLGGIIEFGNWIVGVELMNIPAVRLHAKIPADLLIENPKTFLFPNWKYFSVTSEIPDISLGVQHILRLRRYLDEIILSCVMRNVVYNILYETNAFEIMSLSFLFSINENNKMSIDYETGAIVFRFSHSVGKISMGVECKLLELRQVPDTPSSSFSISLSRDGS